MNSAVDLTAFFAALRAFCARSGNASRLALVAGVGPSIMTRLRRGSRRGVSDTTLARIVDALATLPYIPEEFAPGARDTLAPEELDYLRARVSRALTVYRPRHLVAQGAPKSALGFVRYRPRGGISRSIAERIHRALDSLSVPRDPEREQRPDVPQHLRDAMRRLALQLIQEETTQ